MFKLSRIDETDIFYFSTTGTQTPGDILVEGTLDEVLVVANELKATATDLGEGDSVPVTDQLSLMSITDAKWFVSFINDDLVLIVRTSGDKPYSIPMGQESYQEPLDNIIQRIVTKYADAN